MRQRAAEAAGLGGGEGLGGGVQPTLFFGGGTFVE